MAQLFIGALSKATGVPRKTIRYYEELGLLKPVQRTRGGFRVYDGNIIPILRFIRHAEHLGFSLKEIRQVLQAWQRTGHTCDVVRAITQQKLGRLEKMVEQLTALRERLQVLSHLLEKPDDCGPRDPCVCVFVMNTPPLKQALSRLLAEWAPSHRKRKRRRRRQRPTETEFPEWRW